MPKKQKAKTKSKIIVSSQKKRKGVNVSQNVVVNIQKGKARGRSAPIQRIPQQQSQSLIQPELLKNILGLIQRPQLVEPQKNQLEQPYRPSHTVFDISPPAYDPSPNFPQIIQPYNYVPVYPEISTGRKMIIPPPEYDEDKYEILPQPAIALIPQKTDQDTSMTESLSQLREKDEEDFIRGNNIGGTLQNEEFKSVKDPDLPFESNEPREEKQPPQIDITKLNKKEIINEIDKIGRPQKEDGKPIGLSGKNKNDLIGIYQGLIGKR